MKNKVPDPRLARREAESRVCRGRGDDELISASLSAGAHPIQRRSQRSALLQSANALRTLANSFAPMPLALTNSSSAA